MLGDVELTCTRWVQWFHILPNTKYPNLNPSVIDDFPTWSTCKWPEYVILIGETMKEAKEAVQSMVNGKSVSPDVLPAELLRLLLDNDAGLSRF